MSTTITGGFQYRVNFAAAYMVRGITNSRALDNCFEMWDGDIVVTALVRRAAKNPKLYAAIARQWRDGFPQSWIDTAAKYAHVKTRQLPDIAAAIRAEREAAHHLSCKLTKEGKVRTHTREGNEQNAQANPWSRIGDSARAHQRGRKRIVTGRGRGGQNKRAVIVNGREFSSMRAARVALGIGNNTIRNWLDTGRAKYVGKP
jgi:hypothetical protein